jgi:hypothetical protein
MVPQSCLRTRFVKDFIRLLYREVPGLDALDCSVFVSKLTIISKKKKKNVVDYEILEGTKALFLKYMADEAFKKNSETT